LQKISIYNALFYKKSDFQMPYFTKMQQPDSVVFFQKSPHIYEKHGPSPWRKAKE
jgi:hypothetical protein